MRFALLVLAALLAGFPLLLDDEVLALNLKAKNALESGRPADAVLFLQAALVRTPDDDTLRQNLAWAHYKVGEVERAALSTDRAAAAFARAWEVWDGEPAYGLHLSSLRLRAFRLDEALAAAEAVLARHPESADAQQLAADALALLDRLDEAEAAYRKAAAGKTGDDAAGALQAAERTARQRAVERGYATLRTGSFVIRAPAGTDHLSLTGVLERARVEVLTALSVTRSEPALVVLYPPDDFREVTGAHAWVGGLFDRKIRLPIADSKRDQDTIEASFRHEYTHLLVSEWSPRCPTFLNEGLAQLFESGRGQGMARLTAYLKSRGRSRDSAPQLAELPDSFVGLSNRAEVELGYLTSYAFVDHVAEHHGLGTVVSWVRQTDAYPLAEAYQRASGRSLQAEESLFRELLRTAR